MWKLSVLGGLLGGLLTACVGSAQAETSGHVVQQAPPPLSVDQRNWFSQAVGDVLSVPDAILTGRSVGHEQPAASPSRR